MFKVLDRLGSYSFNLPINVAVKRLQNVGEVFWIFQMPMKWVMLPFLVNISNVCLMNKKPKLFPYIMSLEIDAYFNTLYLRYFNINSNCFPAFQIEMSKVINNKENKVSKFLPVFFKVSETELRLSWREVVLFYFLGASCSTNQRSIKLAI